jgi:hypothetical protein
MPNTTFILGYRTAKEATDSAAEYRELGFATAQIGPTAGVHVEPGTPTDWPEEADQSWYLMIATKDKSSPAFKKKPAAGDA